MQKNFFSIKPQPISGISMQKNFLNQTTTPQLPPYRILEYAKELFSIKPQLSMTITRNQTSMQKELFLNQTTTAEEVNLPMIKVCKRTFLNQTTKQLKNGTKKYLIVVCKELFSIKPQLGWTMYNITKPVCKRTFLNQTTTANL